MDYGHPLQFGASLTPTSAAPQAAVDLAVLSEDLGYDLVAVEDRPDDPSRLDAWTTLGWIAGRTHRIDLAATAVALPVRPAPVLARAAASLDLLSGGRLSLGLGAGTSGAGLAALASLGSAALAPSAAYDALEESIEVIRETWADDGTPLHHLGTHHRLAGATRGPAPAHDLPIWISGNEPRALHLAGRVADGWVASLTDLDLTELAARGATIDAAAERAGRDAREIRRLLVVPGDSAPPSERWVEQLVTLAIEDGIGTFIVRADDPDTLRRFARDVAPTVRESVAAERSSRGTRTGIVPSLQIRSRRRDGIDYDAIPATLAASGTVEPGSAAYGSVRSNYLRGGSPGLVLLPRTVAEVVDALAYASAQPVPLSVRSAGHGISGRSTNDGGIIIDLSRLAAIEVLDPAARRVRIEPGARWGEVAAALQPHGWALSSGDYGGVGVGGLATAGGIGWLVREHGLTIDHLRAVDIVLADGRLVHASADEHPDLFWGVRGAGANFGIVVSFEFEVDEVGDIGFAQLAVDATDTAGFLERWGALVESSPRDVTSFLIIGRARHGQPTVAQVMIAVDSDDPDHVISRLQPFARLAPLLQQSAQIVPYAALVSAPPKDHQAQGEPVTRSALVEHITPEFAAAATALVRSGESYFFQIRSAGGAVADVAPEATAYAHRSANFSVVAFGSSRTGMDRVWDAMADHFSGLYLSFESDPRPERIHDAFPPEHLARLRELKHRYDPDNTFRDNFNVAPTPLPVT